MIRIATTSAALALGLCLFVSGAASAEPSPADRAEMAQQIVAAEAAFDARAYGRVVEALAPAIDPEVYATLPEAMQYQALGLFARSLYGLGAFDVAHDAFVALTAHPDATAADWALRAETAERIGDDEDAAEAQSKLDGEADDLVASTPARGREPAGRRGNGNAGARQTFG